MTAYYNEIEPYPAQWLRNLITAGLIAPGEVDERSIVDVSADDVRGFTQCHFFAGIGIWSHALRLAGWPDEREVWTGSCPCQPFSAAGRGAGIADARHLWPHFFRLIRERRPVACLGEQVSGADGLAWLDHVFLDLEAEAYTCGAISAPACSVGAPHIRQRLYWMAYAQEQQRRRLRENNTDGIERQSRIELAENSATSDLADTAISRRSRCENPGATAEGWKCCKPERKSATGGFWRDAEWLPCIDGKARPTKPGTFPLAHGYPGRVGILRAAGNAIVAPQAAEFIKAAMSLMP